MADDKSDERLDEIQHRIDDIREHVAHDPGFDVIDEDDVPAYFRTAEEQAAGGLTKEEAERRDPGGDHQGHAPG